MVHDAGKTIGIMTPRITTSREIVDTMWLCEQAASFGFDHALVHNIGALRLAKQFGLNCLADYSLPGFDPIFTHYNLNFSWKVLYSLSEIDQFRSILVLFLLICSEYNTHYELYKKIQEEWANIFG